MLRPEALWKFDSSPSAAYTDYTNNVRTNATIGFIDAAAQYYYIGFGRRMIGMYIDLSTNGSYTGLSYEYYTGSAWVKLSLIDSYTFSESKYLRWVLPDQWQKYRLTDTDPHAATPPDSVERYWIRINATAVTTQAVISKIRIVPYSFYTNPTKVSQFMQLKKDFDNNTTPSELAVDDLIARAESHIDYMTYKSWKFNVSTDELVAYNRYGVYPRRRDLTKMYSVSIWNGGAWDVLTEGRNQDYFVDYDRGMIYFTRLFLLPATYGFTGRYFAWGFGEYNYSCKLNYIYGKDPETDAQFSIVEDIATKLAAVDIIKHHDYSALMSSGTDRVDLVSKTRFLEEEIDRKLEGLKGATLW